MNGCYRTAIQVHVHVSSQGRQHRSTDIFFLDKADKGQSSRHIPCAGHLEFQQDLDCGQHVGACLLLLSTVSLFDGTR